MRSRPVYFIQLFIAVLSAITVFSQPPAEKDKQSVRTVTIPISIFTKDELKNDQPEEFIDLNRLIVKEDKDEQVLLSVRNVVNTPISLAVLVQDDLSQEINLQLNDLRKFIQSLPKGSRVMVGYLRGGTYHQKQKFTDNLERAAAALTIVGGTTASNGPYEGVSEALNYFDALPTGRRAILLISDGLEASRGGDPIDTISSPELDRAILKAQRKAVAVYSIFSPT